VENKTVISRGLLDQNNPDAEPVPIEIVSNELGVDITVKGEYNRASVFVEYYDGEVVARVWNEEDENNDPTVEVKLVEDPYRERE
jgi:hypothetical protein